MIHHHWEFLNIEWAGTSTKFHWRCERCGTHAVTETHYQAGERHAYLHMPEWKPRIEWQYDCDEEAAQLVHES